jgi:hypothetical protein
MYTYIHILKSFGRGDIFIPYIHTNHIYIHVMERIRNLSYHVYKSIELKEGDASADKIPCLYSQAVTHIHSFIHTYKKLDI